jgi:glycosyltransferase involved in cell wall biosynthesis
LYNFSTNYICEKCVGKKYKLSIIKDHCDRRGYLYSLVKGIRSFVSDNILKHREVIDTFICPSDFLRSKLLEDGVDSQRIKMIRNPISIYSPLKASSKKNIICYFGRFSREKNLEFLLDTFAEWKTRAKNDFRLLLIGGGEEEKALKERAARSPIASSISFKEYMPYEQLVDQLADVKYLSLTSLCFENSPMTVLESISMNIIPLVPNIGGMNESVESFTHIGKTFQINSKESWIQAIECLEKNYTTEMDNLIRRKKAIFEETGTSAYYKKLYDVYGAP